jgi:hypothetical protein
LRHSSFQHYINHTRCSDILDRIRYRLGSTLVTSLFIVSREGEHRRHTLGRGPEEWLIDEGLAIDIRKCEFSVTETKVPYLEGSSSQTSGTQNPDGPGKVPRHKPTGNWELPNPLKDLQALPGFVNFYRRFIHSRALRNIANR